MLSLTSVNGFHHWLLIRRCSCMFDFISHICMLRFVLCSGRDGAQDPGLFLINIQAASSLWIIMIYYMTLLIGWLRPYLSLLVDPYFSGWMRPYLGSHHFSTFYGWLHPYHISCIREISCICTRRSSDSSVFSWTRSHKAFHPFLSLGPHALRGICYTSFCHRPRNPSSRTLEDYSRDL